jgi:hypothetical protein
VKRFTFGRCPDCEFIVPLQDDGTVARHYRRFHTHAHQIVKQLCIGYGFECTGSPISVAATTARRARDIARGECAASARPS